MFLDFETNGLLRQPGLRAHCMAWAIDDGPVELAVGHEAIASVLAANTQVEAVAHYGTGFDFPLAKMLFGWVPAKVFDTKVAGSLFDPEFSGTHSLADWGVRVHAPKDDYAERCKAAGIDPWAEYSEDMGAYCKADVATLRSIYRYMEQKWMGDHDWSTALAMEHRISAIMAEQAHVGCWFDMDKALALRAAMQARIAELTEQCKSIIKPRCDAGTEVSRPFNKDGRLSAIAASALGIWSEEGRANTSVQVGGAFSRVKFSEYDLDSRQQVVKLLQMHGWVPTEYTEKGAPRFTEASITASVGPIGKALSDRFITITRLGQLNGWIEKVREDGRIEARAQSNATPTGRMRHSVVVNVAKPGTAWGEEMRALFAVPEGKLMVGVDAAGLELRMLAHYMGDPEFTKQVVEGDVHWYIAQKIGLVPEGVARIKDKAHADYDLHHRVRECEKRWIYATIYGAADTKLGQVLGEFNLPGWHGTEAEGALTRQRAMTKLPKLGALMESIDATLWEKPVGKGRRKRKREWLMGLDGRKLYVRHDHAALNLLLQSAGSIVVKAATVYAHAAMKAQRLGAKQVLHMHDEAAYEAQPEIGGRVSWLFVQGLKWAEKRYKVRCRLDGSVNYGFNWKDVH